MYICKKYFFLIYSSENKFLNILLTNVESSKKKNKTERERKDTR